jgi:hypothetical protein
MAQVVSLAEMGMVEACVMGGRLPQLLLRQISSRRLDTDVGVANAKTPNLACLADTLQLQNSE